MAQLEEDRRTIKKVDPVKQDIASMHKSVEANPRAAITDPEKDPKLAYLNRQQADLEYLVKLNRASLDDKIKMAQERINALDDNAPDYIVKLKREADILNRATNKPLSDEKLQMLEESLAKSVKAEAVATTLLRSAYDSLKNGNQKEAEESFSNADKNLEQSLKAISGLFNSNTPK